MLTFVVPELDGPPTGGTRYNAELIGALRRRGEAIEVLARAEASAAVTGSRERTVWVDSLWMSDVPGLVRAASPSVRVGMLTHYLPALVRHGEAPPRAALGIDERAALDHAEGFIVPSDYLAAELTRLGAAPGRIVVLEPGIELPIDARPAEPRTTEALRAVVVANVTEGKGIRPLLEGLAEHLGPHDALELTVIGSLQMAPDYVEDCAALAGRHPELRRCTALIGSRSYRECIEALLRADVLVSASRMESFGLALADARAAGRPIVARTGGNVIAHVDPRWGGQPVADANALAEALVGLSRDRDQLHERQRRAWAHRLDRPWSTVASQLLRAAGRWPPPRPPQ